MALNVDLSAIHLGNVADIDPNETNAWAENAADLLGTYGGPDTPLYLDRVTLDSDSPTQWIDTDHETGNGTLSYDLGGGPVTTGLESFVTYHATVTFQDGSQITLVVDVIQTLNGDLFLLARDNSGVLGSQGIESIEQTAIEYDDWAGFAQASFDSTQFVCFVPGTRIATPGGARPVESRQRGDRVTTVDRGARQLLWVGARRLRFPPAPEGQKPVEIKPGALGGGLPQRRLEVSPQHRIVVAGKPGVPGAGAALAPAHSLTWLGGVRRMAGKRRVTYVTLLLDRHEIILAEGVQVESLHPGPMAMAVLSPFQRLEVLALAPWARDGRDRRLARPELSVKAARDAARAQVLCGLGAGAGARS